MNPALRKFGFNDALLEDLCTVIKRDIPEDVMNEFEPIRPVSILFCRTFKKPKKAFNAFTKLNIHNFKYLAMKPGYHTFVCKAYNGKVFSVDVAKQEHQLLKHVVQTVLLGLADQILDMKLSEYAEYLKKEEERKTLLHDKLGKDVDLKVPDGMVVDDAMLESINDVLEDIRQKA